MFLALFLKKTGFPGGSVVKNLPTNAEAAEAGSIPGLVRSPGEGNGKPLQYSCLENPMDRGNWWARVHGVAKSWTQLSEHARTHPAYEDETNADQLVGECNHYLNSSHLDPFSWLRVLSLG